MVLPKELVVRLAGKGHKTARSGPLWQGPEGEGPLGGVTFSMLSRFLVCRERFRTHAVEGLQPNRAFSHRADYGNMWHACEEELARQPNAAQINGWNPALEGFLKAHVTGLMAKFPMQREDINHWWQVCRTQFPRYVVHWMRHPDVLRRTPLEQEQVFDVPYKLPSGRVVRLRGKRDSVDLIEDDEAPGVYLQENKTKGDVDEVKLRRQLTFDLQTMMYLVALHVGRNDSPLVDVIPKGSVIQGVRYNVVRRPLSGGKGSIVQRKGTPGGPCGSCKGTGMTPARTKQCSRCEGLGQLAGRPGESDAEFYARLGGVIDEEPGNFFMRWKVVVGPRDVELFRRTCLDPILECLCYWYDWVMDRAQPIQSPYGANMWNWRHPFGVYNSLDEGGATDLDEYLLTGSEVGLTRVDTLFGELQ